MSAIAARRFLVLSSLWASGFVFVFFLIAPLARYPLRWDQSFRVIEIIIPVFLAYLGSSAHFVFGNLIGKTNEGIPSEATNPLLGILIRGPLIVFVSASVALLVAFGFSNRPEAIANSGMSVDLLAAGFTAALGILTVTTNVAVAYLFSLEKTPLNERSAHSNAVVNSSH